MLKLPNYETLEKIHEGKYTLVFRGRSERDEQPVIFKTLTGAYPTPGEIARLKREYEITSHFEKAGIIKALELVSVENHPVIILEDFGATALIKFVEEQPLGMGEFLSLAVRLGNILGEIHAQNIIHKDINPSNIVWNRELDIVKVIDFGISLELSREVTGIKNPNLLEGTLAYISPEQTGRMNRFLDYRTDYYSLGVTFYRLLAGRLPFESLDSMEMVYAHIARQAPALHELDENIPQAVSDIIKKLMAKNVEDRYQSTSGLVKDLERCKREWEESGGIRVFAPGGGDISSRFQIPQKLYGRESEIDGLLTAFERASVGESELMLVSGLPGIGKSALVNEIQKPIVKSRGNFIGGKYDKFKKDVPYSALIQAFSGLVKHLLAENEEQLGLWKEKILRALGPNGRVIIDVIPELELVIGAQGEIAALGPDESRNRFNLYFQFFMEVFCKAEHPLVLFLDDLQWADHASLDMMKLFLSDPDIKHLFVIGSFRSNEVDAGHSLNLTLDEIRKAGTPINSTAVTPLTLEAIRDLLSDSLHGDVDAVSPLAVLLLRKTGGNPFFLGEFLKSLYQDGLLHFVADSGWHWDVSKIEALQVTDNVVTLMAGKIEVLPGDCGALLKLGACFGNYFSLENMVALTGKNPADVKTSLNVLLEAGLLIKRESHFNFAHDRIQEAAYGLIPREQAMEEHHRIGHLELKRLGKAGAAESLFFIVNQLNSARELADSREAKEELAHLNLQAGIKARSSAAYGPALNYLDVALSLLDTNAWESEYEFTHELHEQAAIAAFLWGDFKRMDALADTVIDKARSVTDTVRVYELKIFSAMAQNQLLEAVRIGLLSLKKLGLSLPNNPGKVNVLLGLLSVKWALRGKTSEYLENLPELTEPRRLGMSRILSSITSAAYISVPDLMPLLLFNMLKISSRYGNSEFSPYSAYGGYGIVLCGLLGDMDEGYKYAKLALRLADKITPLTGNGRALYVAQGYVVGWKEHLRNTLEPFKQSVRLGMEHGDPEFVGHAAVLYISYGLFCGNGVAELEQECTHYRGIFSRLNQLFTMYRSSIEHQFLLNLLGKAEDPCRLKGEIYDYDDMLAVHEASADKVCIYASNFYTGYLNYLFGRYEVALSHFGLAEVFLDSMVSTFFVPMLFFYKALSQLALYPNVDRARQKKFMGEFAGIRKKMKHWVSHAPMNFEHKLQLLDAEKARVLGQEVKARGLYKQAIRGARENEYINEEALALELFAKFWLNLEEEDIAVLYLSKARQAYRSWGALARVKDLEETYSEYISRFVHEQEEAGVTIKVGGSLTKTTEHETTDRSPSGKLDLATVMKGSQAIAGEIVLGNLLRKMIKIVMENAGARSGFLILEYKDKLYVEAVGDLESEDVSVLESLPLDTCPGLSPAVVQYTARTKEMLVLNDAAISGPFSGDAYIIASRPKSILCVPVLNQGKLSAILYLENNLSAGAFTADRLEVLNMLSSQIAVSIDNARLYGNLEEKVEERTAELRDTLDQVQELKKKQDGDYFLTSLLINPLARNEVKSKQVSVAFLVEQFKKFKYERWENELGGDMCIANSLVLENSPHTVWLNADAMGKSMQGAGGALVLGAVFQSIIERTRLSSFDESQSAAAWVQAVFKELQKVFESFDGSMLVSLVLGVVNDGSGTLHLINGEHPFTVLFRKGKASFIEEDVSLYKLGALEQEKSTHVYAVQLEAGDVVIAGSDGRDDIWLADTVDEFDGGRIMNADDSQFLRRVEEGGGELAGIKAGLLKLGELTDDLSLLRLEYK